MDLREKLVRTYGDAPEEMRMFQSPGRVNLIGEHIDYNGGSVFPAALTMVSTVCARKRRDNTIQLLATDLDEVVRADYHSLDEHRGIRWGNYQLGVAKELLEAGYKLAGCDMIFEDKVPLGSGLSSSAAIEVVTAFTLLHLSGYHDVPLVEIARIAQRAEHRFVGVHCGIMDQFASAMGKKDHAILLDTRTLEYRHVPMDMKGYKVVIANTNKKRSLGDSAYNQRRKECEQALADIQVMYGDIDGLCQLSLQEFEQGRHLIRNEKSLMRAYHAVTENDRVHRSVAALEAGDMAAFGDLLTRSHVSLRDQYEVSCKELDTLVELALECPGVAGSRMTGAGFGGCTVSIVREGDMDGFIDFAAVRYEERIGYPAAFYISEIGDGVKEVTG
ncbi:MAG: galactokinase [Clostridia bacterium]